MIEFVRIDDRLIHGQVASAWMKSYSIEQAIIVSDELAGDPMQLTILEIAAPDGVKVHLFGVKQFAEINKGSPIKRRTMVIFTNPMDVLTCAENGLDIDKLNVGGMRFREGKQKLTKAVSVTEYELAAFQKLVDRGMDVYIQMVPNDKIVKMEQFLNKG